MTPLVDLPPISETTPITEILARNAQLYGSDVCLVEINPEVDEARRITWKDFDLVQPSASSDPTEQRRSTTWKKFDDLANRFANLLLSRGLKKGDKVAILLMNCLEWLPVYFGALKAGACGVSLGPAYTPGSSIMEMQALCAVAKQCGKPVSIDTRMNSMTDLNSLQEAIDLAAHSGCRMIVSHFVYQYGVGVEDEAMAMVDRARGMGVDIVFDSGMYKDWCSSIGAALFEPGIMRANGIELYHLRMITGEHIGMLPDQELYDHLRECHPDDAVVVNTGSQRAVYAIARHEQCMVSTDTGAYKPGEGHPQIGGSFPRFMREMVRERADLTWEEAVWHTTLHPAQVLGFENKGRISPGCDADLVIFNPETIRDTADYPGIGMPNGAPEGIGYVIVSGEIAAQNGKTTGTMAGRTIRC